MKPCFFKEMGNKEGVFPFKLWLLAVVLKMPDNLSRISFISGPWPKHGIKQAANFNLTWTVSRDEVLSFNFPADGE